MMTLSRLSVTPFGQVLSPCVCGEDDAAADDDEIAPLLVPDSAGSGTEFQRVARDCFLRGESDSVWPDPRRTILSLEMLHCYPAN